MLQLKSSILGSDKTIIAINAIAVTAVDRTGNESNFKEIIVK